MPLLPSDIRIYLCESQGGHIWKPHSAHWYYSCTRCGAGSVVGLDFAFMPHTQSWIELEALASRSVLG